MQREVRVNGGREREDGGGVGIGVREGQKRQGIEGERGSERGWARKRNSNKTFNILH